MIQLSIGHFLGFLTCVRGNQIEGKYLTWNGFVDQLERAATGRLKGPRNEEHYVSHVTALFGRLAPHEIQRFTSTRKGHPRRTPAISLLERRLTFEINLLVFDRGDVIPHHNHPQMTGVGICTKGTIMVESCDLVSRLEDGRCILRKAGETTLSPRQVTTLTSHRHNIHGVIARESAELIDIFTPPYTRATTERVRWYTIDRPAGPGNEVFRAIESSSPFQGRRRGS